MDKLKYISIALCIVAIILFIIASSINSIKPVIIGFILIGVAIIIHKYAISSMKDKIIEEKYKEINKNIK